MHPYITGLNMGWAFSKTTKKAFQFQFHTKIKGLDRKKVSLSTQQQPSPLSSLSLIKHI